MDIVVAYCERWDTPLVTSKHHYINRLADSGHRILYIEIPPSPLNILWRFKEFRSLTIPRLNAGVDLVRPNVWAMTGLYPLPYHRSFGGVFDKLWINEINQRVIYPRIQKALTKLDFLQPVLISYYPFLFPSLDRYGFSKIIFHMVDEWQGMSSIPNSMAFLTRRMLEKADMTIVTSQRLFERYRTYTDKIMLLRHGMDRALFEPVSRGEVASDPRLIGFSGPCIGYYGALFKLDSDLIKSVANRCPDWNFIFIGPRGRGSRGGRGKEVMLPNVYFWPPQERKTLPAFLAGIDIFWLPFRINELSKSMSPIKVYEALSAGLPLVVSDLEETRAVAGELALYAVNTEEHLEMLNRSLNTQNEADRFHRSKSVQGFDWDERYKEFSRMLTG